MKKITLFIVILLILTTGCQPAGFKNKIFRTALYANPTSIDPMNAIDGDSQAVVNQLFDSLLKYNVKTNEIKPGVATSWKISKDAKIFTFYLRKGSKFHNGEEVTANNFKSAWDYISNPKNKAQASYYFEPVLGFNEMQEGKSKSLKGVRVLDKYTLEIKLSEPNADFFSLLHSTAFAPLPKNFKNKNFAKNPIGNGPYKFIYWKRNKEIKINKFKNYYDPKAKIKSALFKIFKDQSAGIREFRAGNIDDTLIPQNQVNLIKAKNDERIVEVPILSTFSYGFNLKKKPFNNKNLRLAILHAIDKNSIVKKVAPKNTKTARSFTPKIVKGNDKDLMDNEFSLIKTKKYLKKAGYDKASDVKEIHIAYSADGSSNEKVAQVLQNQLQNAGFKVKLDGFESGTFIDKMMNGDFGLFQLKWIGSTNFEAFLAPLFTSKNIGVLNVTYYSNKKFDSLIRRAHATIDEEKRIEMYKKAESLMLSDAPVLPLFYDTSHYLVKTNVVNYNRSSEEALFIDELSIEK